MAGKLHWISSSGGPLLVLPEELLESWGGIDPPRGGRVVKSQSQWDPKAPATDYDRACDVQEAMANIDVGQGRGILLAEEPYHTAFVPRDDGGLLVRWVQADSEETILRHLEGFSFDTAEDAEVAMIEARPGPLLVFDAACPGGEVEEDRLVVDVHPGQYLATATRFRPDETTSLFLVRLQRVG